MNFNLRSYQRRRTKTSPVALSIESKKFALSHKSVILTTKLTLRMSDAGDNDNVKVEEEAEAEAPEVAEAPRGKLSVEEALEVHTKHTQFVISF